MHREYHADFDPRSTSAAMQVAIRDHGLRLGGRNDGFGVFGGDVCNRTLRAECWGQNQAIKTKPPRIDVYVNVN